MSITKRTLFPGDLDHPHCICGKEMRLATIEPTIRDPNTTLHTFECVACGHCLKVMHERAQAA